MTEYKNSTGKTEYRKALPEEGPKILDFINLVFSMAGRPHNFRKLLPRVYAYDDFRKLHYVAVRDGQVLATVALLPFELKHHAYGVLKGGYVGSVSVHPYYRSEGHMKALMNMLLEDARQEGYDFLALGGRRQRYGYFGFGKADPVLEYEVDAANVKHALRDTDDEGIDFITYDPEMTGIAEKIRNTYYAGENTCERGSRFNEYLYSWMTVPAVITDRGQYIGYVCHRDEIVMELGLDDPDEIQKVIKAFVKRFGSMRGQMSLYDSRLRNVFAEIAEDVSIRDMQMIRVLNWPKMLCALLAVREEVRKIPDGCYSFAVRDEGSWCISVKNGVINVSENKENECDCLAPEKAADLFFSLSGAVECDDPWLKALLPLPFHMSRQDHF